MCSTQRLTDAGAAGDHRPAMTYHEYLQKYYGDRARRSPKGDNISDHDNETSYLSDGCVDYDGNQR